MDAFSILSLIFLIVIGLGLGATTTKNDFDRALGKPKAPLIGFLSQYIFMPLFAFALSKAFSMKEEYAVGVILVGCSPGGTTSNIFSYWSKGNVALSIVMSFCSTLAAFAMLPLLIYLLIKLAYGANIEIPWGNIFLSLVLVIFPCLIGLCVRHYNKDTQIGGKFIWQWLELLTTVFGIIFFAAAIIAAFALYHRDMAEAPASLWVTAALMEPAGAAFGYLSAYSQGLSRKDCRTIAIETGVQSFTLTMAIIALSFDGDERDDALIFPILYGVMYLINSLWLVLLLRYYVAPLDEPEEEEEEEDSKQEFKPTAVADSSNDPEGNGNDEQKKDEGVAMVTTTTVDGGTAIPV